LDRQSRAGVVLCVRLVVGRFRASQNVRVQASDSLIQSPFDQSPKKSGITFSLFIRGDNTKRFCGFVSTLGSFDLYSS
jgi:hypothetical protein